MHVSHRIKAEKRSKMEFDPAVHTVKPWVNSKKYSFNKDVETSCPMEPSTFDIWNVTNNFEQALVGQRDVNLTKYVEAFEEVSRLFSILGVVFSFVESDVSEKRRILQNLLVQNPANYSTIENMLVYECFDAKETGQSPSKRAEPIDKGSRTLLRLHRANKFLFRFVKSLQEEASDKSAAELFRSAYQETLADHHTWLVRKSVALVSHTIPNRNKLLETIFNKSADDLNDEEMDKTSNEFLDSINKVYDRVQNLYEEKDLLNLP